MAGWISTRCISYLLLLYTVIVVLLLIYHFSPRFWSPTEVTKRHPKGSPGPRLYEDNSHLFVDTIYQSSTKAQTRPEAFQQNQKSPFSPVRNGMESDSVFAETKPLQETFQAVNNNSIFVYSAYYLRNLNPREEVTVIAIVNRSAMTPPYGDQISCVYDGDGGTSVRAKLRIFPDHHGHTFSPAYISCPPPKALTRTSPASPVTVSLSIPQDPSLANGVRVQTPGPRRHQFLVCFSPLHNGFGDAEQIVANLELARVLGADQAVVYNTSISPRVDRILRHYVSKGFLQVKAWLHPPEPIHYKGQLGAINDCLLHNSNRTEFIVFMDFDEMIVPRVHASWSSFMLTILNQSSSSDYISYGKAVLRMKTSFLDRIVHNTTQSHSNPAGVSKPSPLIGAVSFPSAVFLWDKPTNLSSEELRFAQQFHVKYLLKQRRTQQLWELRAKNIVNPRAVDIMGIHRVHSFRGRQMSVLVNETVGLLQHYRWYSNVPSVKDINVLRFSSVLIDRMKKTFRELDSV